MAESMDSVPYSSSLLIHIECNREANQGQSLPIWSRQRRIFGIPVSIASICIPSSCLSLLITFGVELLLPLSSIINEVVMSRFAEK